MIDTSFTENIKTELGTNGVYVGSVFTPEEIDFLLCGDRDATRGYATKLAEEGILRSTGLKVDLSVQGPASEVVTMAGKSKDQQHNTYIVSDENLMTRRYDKDNIDAATIPKVTPQDANRAVKSLDFPNKKIRGTPLDGMRLDDKDNIVEQAFKDQITVAQVLYHYGANVTDMTEWINRHWGIDYAMELVTETSLAPAKDLEHYIASGGRPSACLYYSSNIVSRYKLDAEPKLDVKDVGYSGAFYGRAKQTVKFIMANCHMFYGNDSIHTMSFHMDPISMSKFNGDTFKKFSWPKDTTVSSALGKETIDNFESYDSYVGARVSLKQMDRNIAKRAGAAVEATLRPKIQSLTMPNSADNKVGSKDIMTSGYKTNKPKIKSPELATPSKVTTVLFGYFHDSRGGLISGRFGVWRGFCNFLLTLCTTTSSRDNVYEKWHLIVRNPSVRAVLDEVNLTRAMEIGPLKALAQDTVGIDRRLACRIYLVNRQVALMSQSVRQGIDNCNQKYAIASSMLNMNAVKDYKMGELKLPLKMLTDHLSRAVKVRPYAYAHAILEHATNDSGQASMLNVDLHRLDKFLSTEVEAGDVANVTPMLANIRNHWADEYRRLRAVDESSYKLWIELNSNIKINFSIIGKELVTDHDYACWVGTAFILRVIYNHVMELAYRWSMISSRDLKVVASAGDTAETLVRKTYDKYRAKLAVGDRVEFTVDMAIHQLGRNSLLSADIDRRVKDIVTKIGGTTKNKKAMAANIARVIRSAYSRATDQVSRTVQEAVETDYKVVHHLAYDKSIPEDHTGSFNGQSVGNDKHEEPTVTIDAKDMREAIAIALSKCAPKLVESMDSKKVCGAKDRLAAAALTVKSHDAELSEALNAAVDEVHEDYTDEKFNIVRNISMAAIDVDNYSSSDQQHSILDIIWEYLEQLGGSSKTKTVNIMK